jgi:TPR repeat protein
MVVDETFKHTRTKSPATNFIKSLLVISFFVLAAPVLANDKQAVIDECDLKYKTNDYNSAFPACKQAAKQGDANAQSILGVMFYDGEGTPKDDKQAFHWYTKAAEQGEASSQSQLGEMFYFGKGTPQDYEQAIYWYTKAVEQGDATAQFSLGGMFASGQGTPKNNVLAYVWWNIAAAQGDKYAEEGRGIIEGIMTPNQIAEAQKLSREYYAKYVK